MECVSLTGSCVAMTNMHGCEYLGIYLGPGGLTTQVQKVLTDEGQPGGSYYFFLSRNTLIFTGPILKNLTRVGIPE